MAAQPTMTYEPLRGPIWTISEGIYRTIFLEGETGVVAFDTFYSPGAALSYRLALGRLWPLKEIHTVVYSHDHLDHSGYAANLAPGAEVIAHEEAAAVIEARRSDGQRVPTERFGGERASYTIDGVSFELVNPGPTHGNGNVAAWFPDQRLLFMVDTAIPGVGYTFFPDWHLSRYQASMQRMLELDWDLFVPGHFWPIDRAGVEENLAFFDVLFDVAQRALGDGVDPDNYVEVTAYAKAKLAEYSGLFRFHEYIGLNLMRFMQYWLTGGWGLEDGP
jgi:glyoxylase-like metal-dependent hydrolase (beta-lactamase superfamily II)